MKNIVLKLAPFFFQNIAISIYNTWLYRKRRGGVYWFYRRYFEYFDSATREEVEKEQSRRLSSTLRHAVQKSAHYKDLGFVDLKEFPLLDKETLLTRLSEVSTIPESEAEVSLTGGTTGASMKVLYKNTDIQERQAMLDHFRAQHGYVLGKRTAWFSGKDLARESDLKKGRCYRDDWINRIRFFSTFHINERNFDNYWNAIIEFSPEFLVGFPSSVYDICVMAKERGLSFKGVVKGFFPTAETVLPQHRDIINEVLGCPLIDQYASSEGAPFILQCREGNMHIHPLTGVFEVVDDDFKPSLEGEILVTSFSTRGTPLIRYRIGDRIRLSPGGTTCQCGSHFPLVEEIDGRSNDFIWSLDNGKVNLGNISNCTKDAPGIICFQVSQHEEQSVHVSIVRGRYFSEKDEKRFLAALAARLGGTMQINIEYVDEIPREKSGKFRLVKNYL